MAAPAFADAEARLAQSVINRLGNALLTDGTRVFKAVLSRDVYPLGEFGGGVDSRHVMTLLQSDYDALAADPVIQYDPASYAPEWISAQPRTSFKLDRIDSRDGNLVKVWLQ